MERAGPALVILAAEGLRQPDAAEVQTVKGLAEAASGSSARGASPAGGWSTLDIPENWIMPRCQSLASHVG
jgi:hypothetical protein